MAANLIQALKAYGGNVSGGIQNAKANLDIAGNLQLSAKPADGSFSNMVTSAIDTAIDKNNTANKVAMDNLNNKGDLVDVVTAVAEAEMALKTVVTLRDQVVSAYKEVMQIPI